jgi:hypothetical protein
LIKKEHDREKITDLDILNLAKLGHSFDFLYDELDIYTLEDREII